MFVQAISYLFFYKAQLDLSVSVSEIENCHRKNLLKGNNNNIYIEVAVTEHLHKSIGQANK